MYILNENKMPTKPESCGGTTVTSWCKLQTPDESQMLTEVRTKRTVFIVTDGYLSGTSNIKWWNLLLSYLSDEETSQKV